MSEKEVTQVALAIVDLPLQFVDPSSGVELTGKKIHDQMKTNRVVRVDSDGKHFAVVEFNGRDFVFWMPEKGRPRRTITVGKSVADSLIRSSVIAVGPIKEALSNPMVPFLEVVSQYELGEETAPAPKASPTMCFICNTEMNTLPRLTRHYEKHRKTHPDLFESDAEVARQAVEAEANEANVEAGAV